MIHSWADGRLEDTGPLTRKRMETVDDEFVAATRRFVGEAHASGTPFFVWFNTTRMHFRTHVKAESRGRAGRWQSEYHDAMCDHDDAVGSLLDLLDELGLTDDTIVLYSTDIHGESWLDRAAVVQLAA